MSARLKLLCLPPVGASASLYTRWRRGMPPWIEVVPVELPGRGARFGEAFIEDFGALVEQIRREHVDALRQPHALFGHSMGALLAYGIAVRQRACHARQPVVLLATASPAPSRRDPEHSADQDNDAGLIEDMRKQGGAPEEIFANAEICSGSRLMRWAPIIAWFGAININPPRPYPCPCTYSPDATTTSRRNTSRHGGKRLAGAS